MINKKETKQRMNSIEVNVTFQNLLVVLLQLNFIALSEVLTCEEILIVWFEVQNPVAEP